MLVFEAWNFLSVEFVGDGEKNRIAVNGSTSAYRVLFTTDEIIVDFTRGIIILSPPRKRGPSIRMLPSLGPRFRGNERRVLLGMTNSSTRQEPWRANRVGVARFGKTKPKFALLAKRNQMTAITQERVGCRLKCRLPS